MKIALPMSRRQATLARRSRDIAFLASLVAFGTVAWEHLMHVSVLSPGDTLAAHLTHALRDGFLALPLALAAVLGGLWLAQRVGMRQHRLPDLLGRATLIALGFVLLLVPSVGLHEIIDRALMGQGPVLATVLAGHGGLGGLLLHGVGDALVGLPIALLLSILGVLLLAGSPAAPSCRRWLPRAVQLVSATVVLVVLLGAGFGRGWLSGPAPATGAAYFISTDREGDDDDDDDDRSERSAGVVRFRATDEPGPWFQCIGNGCVQAGTQSLAIVQPNTPVKITVGNETNTVHTFTSLLFPTGARKMPFDQRSAFRAGSRTANLKARGFTSSCARCIHSCSRR